MSKRNSPQLRLIRGGLDDLRIGPLRVMVASADKPPFAAAATVLEEDTWLVMSAEPEVRPPAYNPMNILTELLEAEPLIPGSVVVGNEAPLLLLAAVYDLGEEPICRPEWVRAALMEVLRIAEERGIASLALPLLGVHHGRLPVAAFVDIFTNRLRESRFRHLRKVWLTTEPALTREVRSLLEAHAN